MPKGVTRTEEQALKYIQPILPLLQRGMSELQACHYAKVSVDTVNLYKRKWESVNIEMRTAKMALVAVASDTVAKAAKEDPKIALEVLKRRSKETWGDSVDLTSAGQPITALVRFVDGTEPK